ncbi:hypothetical protein L1987_85665 [Smallanthus sonchifolius]|uniref:Uncharacterized protein n=1 Tax=Smallanthus sonchifolius TaxID=185202 RepID=A0ACB8XWL7_9ASTR|nr:hypothetical protein L1987_85665 [Smallanthus sonchifolius]
MAEVIHDDVLERILIGLDVKNLIRCKSVCKSWHFLIKSPGFIDRHLNYSYNKDRCNSELRHRRIFLVNEFACTCYDDDHIVGSSNGLVCVSFNSKLLVGNPSTREVRPLVLPPWIRLSSCCGFGYDSFRDDYKVVVGGPKGENQTCVQVLSLKSNIWRVIEEVKYVFIRKVGILWNDALYWIVRDSENTKKLIISYDLSKDEFKEIPQPDDAKYECTSDTYLGIVKECLCIFDMSPGSLFDVWLMKKYNVKQSWELLPHDGESQYDIVHYLKTPKDYILPEGFLLPDKSYVTKYNLLEVPVFVQSLVSPHHDKTVNLTSVAV